MITNYFKALFYFLIGAVSIIVYYNTTKNLDLSFIGGSFVIVVLLLIGLAAKVTRIIEGGE